MARITISIPDDLKEELEEELEYGDSRSEWVQIAIRQRLADERGDSENRNPADQGLPA